MFLLVAFALLSTRFVLFGALAVVVFWGVVIYALLRLTRSYVARRELRGKTLLAVVPMMVIASMIITPTHATIPGTQDYRNTCALGDNYSRQQSPANGGDSYAAVSFGNTDPYLLNPPTPPCGSFTTDYNGVGNVIAYAGANSINCGSCSASMLSTLTLADQSFTVSGNTQTLTFSGDYYMYGFLDIQGQGAIAAVFAPDAFITVSLAVSGPSSFNWTLTQASLEDTHDGCGGTVTLSYSACNVSKTFSSDATFSENALLTPGTYTLKMGFVARVYVSVSGGAGASAFSCFGVFSGCYSCPMAGGCISPYPAQGPTTCPAGLVDTAEPQPNNNNCDWVQWKYTTYTVDPVGLSSPTKQLDVDCDPYGHCPMYDDSTGALVSGSTIALTSTSNGMVSLSSSGSPCSPPYGCWSFVWQQNPVSISAGEVVNDFLTIHPPYSVSTGWFYLTVTGTNGAVTGTMTIPVYYRFQGGGGGCSCRTD